MRESGIQTAIETYLRIQENLGRLCYQKNNSGAAKIFSPAGARYIRFGKAGAPDFLVFLPGGRTVHLEVKNEDGCQNCNQKAYQARIEDLGHFYCVVRSVDEAEAIIKPHLTTK